MKLYVFNPDTDMALANNEENYMAPASACRMAQDLALLPVWYAQPGSAVQYLLLRPITLITCKK